MNLPPRVYPGRPYSATEENQARRFARAGQISSSPGMLVTRSANGSTLSPVTRPQKRPVKTVGGALKYVAGSLTYTDTPVPIPLAAPLTDEILGVPTDGMTNDYEMLDTTSATPLVTLGLPGNFLLHYRATCSYDAACAQAKNLSDAVTRLRLKIGGEFREETEVFGTHHAKLCASGLVHEVGLGSLEIGDSYGSPVLTGDLAVTKVAAYNRWTGGKVTINGTFQLTVILDGSGNPQIATGLPEEEGDPAATCAPTLELFVDRSAIEPDPGISPLEWLTAAGTVMIVHSAQLHVIRLS